MHTACRTKQILGQELPEEEVFYAMLAEHMHTITYGQKDPR